MSATVKSHPQPSRLRMLWNDSSKSNLLLLLAGALWLAWCANFFWVDMPEKHAGLTDYLARDCALSAQQAREFPGQPLSIADMRLRRDCRLDTSGGTAAK